MLRLLASACLAADATAAVIELDPRVESHQQQIVEKLSDCGEDGFDLILDVRSQYYFENWGVEGAEWIQDFDLRRLYDGSIRKVVFYCWVALWESEPASLWFDANFGHLGIETYDMKGLTYLDDVPGFCPFLRGSDELMASQSPQCAGVPKHTCAPPAPAPEPTLLTAEELAAVGAPVEIAPELASLDQMTAEQFRVGIATALSDYYGNPVDIDLSNLPRPDPASTVSLTDETIVPLVPIHRDTSHDGYYVLSYGNVDGPSEVVIVESAGADVVVVEEAAPAAEEPVEEAEPAHHSVRATRTMKLLRVLLAASVVAAAAAAATMLVRSKRAAVEAEEEEVAEEKASKAFETEEPQFTTENVLAAAEFEPDSKPSTDNV